MKVEFDYDILTYQIFIIVFTMCHITCSKIKTIVGKKELLYDKANILEMFSTWKIALPVNFFSSVNHWITNQQDLVALHYNSKKIVYNINEQIH